MEGCVKFMLRQLQEENILTKNYCLNYIGGRFRVKLNLPKWYTDVERAQHLLKYSLLTQLDNGQ
ncbi:unnamed protein product, partial [Brachionus calyciflorus]